MSKIIFKHHTKICMSKLVMWTRDATTGILKKIHHETITKQKISCLNFWDEACWFLSLRFFFIFIVISTTIQPIYPLAFFRCLSNSGTFMELRTTSLIETMGVACSDFMLLRRQSSEGCRFNPHYRWVIESKTGILNTCTWLKLMESEQGTIKDVVRSSVKVPEYTNTWRRPEDISAETLWK